MHLISAKALYWAATKYFSDFQFEPQYLAIIPNHPFTAGTKTNHLATVWEAIVKDDCKFTLRGEPAKKLSAISNWLTILILMHWKHKTFPSWKDRIQKWYWQNLKSTRTFNNLLIWAKSAWSKTFARIAKNRLPNCQCDYFIFKLTLHKLSWKKNNKISTFCSG